MMRVPDARFERLEDGRFRVRSGSLPTARYAIVQVRVTCLDAPGLEVRFRDVPGWSGDPNWHQHVPGALVPEGLRQPFVEGVQEAFATYDLDFGLEVELLEALVHLMDTVPAQFRAVGEMVVHGWLERFNV